MEDDECENANYGDQRARIEQKDRGRYDSSHPEHHAQPTKTLAKCWGFEHGHAEGSDTYRQEEEPRDEQRIEYSPGHLP